MSDRDSHMPNYPTLEMVLGAIADWVNRHSHAIGTSNALAQCEADELTRIAHDIGVPASELESIVRKGPHSADLLPKMLTAIGLDPRNVDHDNPAVWRDLQRLCINCTHQDRCVHELEAGTAAEHFHEFCQNAFTLDALREQQKLTTH